MIPELIPALIPLTAAFLNIGAGVVAIFFLVWICFHRNASTKAKGLFVLFLLVTLYFNLRLWAGLGWLAFEILQQTGLVRTDTIPRIDRIGLMFILAYFIMAAVVNAHAICISLPAYSYYKNKPHIADPAELKALTRKIARNTLAIVLGIFWVFGLLIFIL